VINAVPERENTLTSMVRRKQPVMQRHKRVHASVDQTASVTASAKEDVLVNADKPAKPASAKTANVVLEELAANKARLLMS